MKESLAYKFMLKLTSLSFLFLALGIFTSVSLLGVSQVFLLPPALYFTYMAIVTKNNALPKSAWFLIAFFIISLVSLILNHSELVHPLKNYGKLRYLAVGFLSIFVLRSYIESENEKMKSIVLNSSLVAISCVGLVCIYQVFFLGQARAKTLTDTLRFGYGMGMILPVILGITLSRVHHSLFSRKLLVLSLFLGFLGMYLTYTRGALLGFLCAVPFVVYFWNKRMGIVSFIVCGLIVSFLGGFYLYGFGEIGNRFISSRHNSSDSIRFSQWETAYIAWREKPLLGIGFSDFINRERAIKVKYEIAHPTYKGHAHNIFLEMLVGTGVLGFSAFLAWLFFWLYEMFKARSEISGLFIPCIVSLVVSGQFETVLDANNASLIFMMYALSTVLKKNGIQERAQV